MSDADRQWAYGPLQPQAPDPWHDRRAQWRKDRWLVPLVAGLGIAATLAFVAVGST